MAKTEFETDDLTSPATSDPSLFSESTSATSGSMEIFSDGGDDIFDMSERAADGTEALPAREEMLSDLPAMQRQHMTAGYREGLSDSKSKSMQGGFDQGYPVGFQLGLRAGKILGVMEGFLAAFAKDQTKTPNRLVELYGTATKELAISQLLGGLEDEVLASPKFEIKDLPVKSRELLAKWELWMVEMIIHKQPAVLGRHG